MLKVDAQVKILSAESKPYSFGGNEGTSHKIRLSVEGEIYACKSSSEQVAEFAAFVGQEGKASIEIVSRKENLSLKVLSFVKGK